MNNIPAKNIIICGMCGICPENMRLKSYLKHANIKFVSEYEPNSNNNNITIELNSSEDFLPIMMLISHHFDRANYEQIVIF